MVELAILLISVCITSTTCMINNTVAADRNYSSPETSPVFQSIYTNQYSKSQHVQWYCFNSTTKAFNCSQVICSKGGPLMVIGCCATYSEDTRQVSFSKCQNFQSIASYNVTTPGYIQLPKLLIELNDYMCRPLNRKGLVCSECADGFGSSVTSFGYRCANCTDAWYGVPLFLFLEFVPITIFYLIILVFQVSVTSAPMPCFITYAQFIVATFYLSIFSKNSIREIIFTAGGDLRLDMKIIHTFYGVFNLDFFRLVLPPFCIRNHLNSIYTAFFGYISVFYPILLICLTWVCVELHGRNLRPLVLLWRPFHRCFVRLRRGWDTKSDIIDVFITFSLLSYNKCLYLTLIMLTRQGVTNYSESGDYISDYHRAVVDLSITFGSANHLLLVIPTIIISFVFNILPPLLLTLYPIRTFRSCLSKCHLNSIAINIFVDKVYGCYRNGLDGGRDMRSFSGLYFLLRIVVYFTGLLSHKLLHHFSFLSEIWFPVGTVFLLSALTTALIKPYKMAYMNYLDALLLSNLALLCFVMSSELPDMLVIARILFLTPIVIFIVIILLRKFKLLNHEVLSWKCYNCCRLSTEPVPSSMIDSQMVTQEKQPLIQTTCIKISNCTDDGIVQ